MSSTFASHAKPCVVDITSSQTFTILWAVCQMVSDVQLHPWGRNALCHIHTEIYSSLSYSGDKSFGSFENKKAVLEEQLKEQLWIRAGKKPKIVSFSLLLKPRFARNLQNIQVIEKNRTSIFLRILVSKIYVINLHRNLN